MKLIKLSTDHYIIVDDSEIKEGDWMFLEQGTTPATKQGWIAQCKFPNADDDYEWVVWKKITHSTQPLESVPLYKMPNGELIDEIWYDKIQQLSLSEVKELIGEVDVEKKAFELYESLNKEYFSGGQVAQLAQTNRERQSVCDGFIIGYNQAFEDGRKYTEEDLMRFYKHVKTHTVIEALNHIQPPTQWDVEFVEGKLKLI